MGVIDFGITGQLFATGWYNPNWSYRKSITIDYTKVGTVNNTDQSNFPVLVNLTSDNDLKTHARSDAFDILFTSSDGSTRIPYERETYTSGTGALVAWVQVPVVSHSANTIIYMYYGYAGATDQQQSTNVWDANFKAVWHLKEATNSGSADATSNGNTGTPQNSPAQGTGQIDGSLTFNGSTQYDNVADASSLDITSAITVESWIKFSTSPATLSYGIDLCNYIPANITANQQESTCAGTGAACGAFDENTVGGFWEIPSPVTLPATITYDFGSGNGKVIRQYTLYAGGPQAEYYTRMPAAWNFQGSNDGSTYFTLDTRSSQSWGSNYLTNAYTFSNSTSYRYYRLSVTTLGSSAGGILRITEIEMMEAVAPVIQKTNAYSLFLSANGAYIYGGIVTGITNNLTVDNVVTSAFSSPTNWHHVVLTFDGSTETLYINGASAGTSSYSSPINNFASALTMGNPFNGIIDEVRVSNNSRSADWIATEYSNQSSPSSFYTLGSEQNCLVSALSNSVTNITCYGGSTGAITLSATGGTSPYQYSITNGNSWQSNPAFSGLTQGSYKIRTKDSNGCMSPLMP